MLLPAFNSEMRIGRFVNWTRCFVKSRHIWERLLTRVSYFSKRDGPAEACAVLEVIKDPEGRSDVTLTLAEAYLLSGDAASVVLLFAGSLNLERPGWEVARAAELLLRAEAEIGGGDSVGPALDAALEQNPDDPRLLVLEAVRSQMLQDPARVERRLTQALELADGPNRQAIQTQLGTFYEGEGRFSEAADLFDEVVGGSAFHPATIPLLICLYRSARRREALALARKIRDSFSQPPKVAFEVEAQILEAAGDIPAVASLLEEVCSRSDSTPSDRLSLALAEFRCGNKDAALETVQAIDVSDLRSEPLAIVKVAHVKRFLGACDYIEDAYRARRYGSNDPDVQMGYFRLFLSMAEDWSEPAIVGLGCAVRIEIEGEEQWWNILENGEEPHGPRDLTQGDDLAESLVGKSVGDTVVTYQILQTDLL